MALLGVVGAVVFIVVASSLGGDVPAASAGVPSLPVGLASRAPTATAGEESAGPAATPASVAGVAIVPVVGFRRPWTSTDAAEIAAIVAGTSSRYAAIEVVGELAGPTLARIGVDGPPPVANVIEAASPAAVIRDVRAHADRLGFVPADLVEPSVRALGWEEVSLFGVSRVSSLDAWALIADASQAVPAGAGYDPAKAWTLVAGGDLNLDGQVAYHVKQLGLGVDFPFDGGTATITGHTCCSFAGQPLPTGNRTGNRGAVRELLSRADLSIANFENPAPDTFDYHPAGFTFSADPALIEGVANAGIDWVSLANNHIGDYGDAGILDTLQNLDRWGIAHGGAEANLPAAREATLLDAGGITVGILGYDTIKPGYAAGADSPGSNQLSADRVAADIQAAREAGAQLVVVVPHWGTEYTAATTVGQQRLAHAAVDAGADLVIGAHSHWAGGVEAYRGVPIFYSLGDFVFNISRSEQTMEGIVLELTFSGTRLVQVRILPHLILDKSQPNLLDPAGSGSVVMKQVFGASPAFPW